MPVLSRSHFLTAMAQAEEREGWSVTLSVYSVDFETDGFSHGLIQVWQIPPNVQGMPRVPKFKPRAGGDDRG